MRLFEAILEANQRRLKGDREARVAMPEFESALPIAALTCIDVRLNHLLPDVLGLPEEKFIWLRNAGNIITNPISSTMRSLALACAVKGAKEIAIIGHTDCQVCATTAMQLLDRLAALGVERHKLPENLVEYFGLFGSERQNIIRSVDFVRASPLIGAKVPIHGLLIDIKTGGAEWVVNGYRTLAAPALPGKTGEYFAKAEGALAKFDRIGHFAADEFKLPEGKIGEIASVGQSVLRKAEQIAAAVIRETPAKPVAEAVPPPPLARPTASQAARAQTPGDKLRLLAKTLRDAQKPRR